MKKYNFIKDNEDLAFVVIENLEKEINDINLNHKILELFDEKNNIIEKIELDKSVLNEIVKQKNFYVLINSQPKDIFILKMNNLFIPQTENKRLKRI